MLYADGQEVKLGDVVKGTGATLKSPVQGTVVGFAPGTDGLNLSVAVDLLPAVVIERGSTTDFALVSRAVPFVPPAPAPAPPAA